MSGQRDTAAEDSGRPDAAPPTTSPFSVTVETGDGRSRVIVAGEVDLATAGALEHATRDALAAGPVTVDLSAVTFMDSAGLRTLGDLARAAQADGGGLRIADGFQRPVARLLDVTGMRAALPIRHDAP